MLPGGAQRQFRNELLFCFVWYLSGSYLVLSAYILVLRCFHTRHPRRKIGHFFCDDCRFPGISLDWTDRRQKNQGFFCDDLWLLSSAGNDAGYPRQESSERPVCKGTRCHYQCYFGQVSYGCNSWIIQIEDLCSDLVCPRKKVPVAEVDHMDAVNKEVGSDDYKYNTKRG